MHADGPQAEFRFLIKVMFPVENSRRFFNTKNPVETMSSVLQSTGTLSSFQQHKYWSGMLTSMCEKSSQNIFTVTMLTVIT